MSKTNSIVLFNSGGQFQDGQDFGVEKWEESNTWHEMYAPCSHIPFVLATKKATRKLSAALVSYSSNSVHLIYFLKKSSKLSFVHI